MLAAAVNWQARRIGAEMKGPGLVPTVFARLTTLVAGLRDASPMIGALRAVKSALELSFIDEAARCANVGLEVGIAVVRVDATENTVAAAMMQAAVAAVSEYVGMQPRVLRSAQRGTAPAAGRNLRRSSPGRGKPRSRPTASRRSIASGQATAWASPSLQTGARAMC